MSGHKTSLNRKIKIIQSIFSNHNRMKLEINSRRKTEKFTNMWKLSNSYATNKSEKKSQGKLENILRQTKMKIQPTKTYGMQQKQS